MLSHDKLQVQSDEQCGQGGHPSLPEDGKGVPVDKIPMLPLSGQKKSTLSLK